MAKWDDFLVSKEFKLWESLKEMCISYDINESRLIDYHDLTDYWEPLFEKIFRLGLQFKQTGKLKEIKIDWMRPMFFSGIEDKLIIDGKCWTTENERESLNKAQELKRNFKDLVIVILEYDKVDATTFKKMKKNLQDNSKTFFKNLILFVTKKLYDQLKTILKGVLRPLLDLRKANYHLFILEKKEEGDSELTFFQDKTDFKVFSQTISQWFKDEEIKLKRDCDMDAFQDFLDKNNNKSYYQYSFAQKPRENFFVKENIKIRKEILQIKFEEGITTFLNYLYVKKPEDFYVEIDIHKMFKNLQVPQALKLKPLNYYISNMLENLKEFKEKLWEMKMNGYCRIKMPITQNTEIISITKKIFDLHILIDKIIGDKLKYDQYIFIYNSLTFIVESNLKEEISFLKDKNFMEDVLPKFVIYNSLRKCVDIIKNMKVKSKVKDEIFDLNNFFQPLKYELDTDSNSLINAWYYTDMMKKQTNPEIEDIKSKLFSEIEEFGGRFWVLEGLFDPADRSLWMDAINLLKDINIAVQDDIRDYIIKNYEHYKNPDDFKRETSKKDTKKDNSRISTNKMSSLKTLKKESTNNRMTSSKGKKPGNSQRRGHHNGRNEKSFDSFEDSVMQRNHKVISSIKIDEYRPPNVWNFPIEKLKIEKDEENKIKIRDIDPRNTYKDGRVMVFLELLNKIKSKMLAFSEEKKAENWKYYFECVLKSHEIVYNFYSEKKKKKNENPDETVILSDN